LAFSRLTIVFFLDQPTPVSLPPSWPAVKPSFGEKLF